MATRGLAWLTGDRRLRALVALGLAVVALRALLPLALEWSIEWQATKQMGRSVEIGDIDLAVLPGAIAIERLLIGPIFEGDEPPPVDPEEAHFSGDRVEVGWSWLALLRGELHLESIELVTPRLLAVRAADGHLVPVLRPDPASAAAPVEPEAEESEEGSGWPLRLDRLRLTDLDALYVDLATAGQRPFELQMEEFALGDLILRDGDVSLGQLGLRAPRLRLRRDIDLAPFTADSPEAGPDDPAPLGVHIAEVALERADFQLIVGDREIETRASFHAREISLGEGTRFPFELELQFEQGSLAIDGEAGAAPPAFDGRVTWSDLPLEPLAAGAEVPLHLVSGATSGELTVRALLATAPGSDPSRVDVSGRIDVADLAASAPDDSFALSWSRLEVELAALVLRPDAEPGPPQPPEVELAAVRLRDPALHVTRTPASSPPSGTPAEPDASQAEPAPDAEPAPRLRVGLLEIDGGSAEFVDESVKPTHRSRIRAFSLRGRDLRWPERDARELRVTARGPGEARIALDASLLGGNGRVALDLENLGLARFGPYVAGASGYSIAGGTASLDSEVEVAGERYAIDSTISLQQLAVGELNAGAFQKTFGIPLDLALALLRDASGTIAIPLAVQLEDGQSSLEIPSLVAGALRQALLGALSTPLKGLALAGGSIGLGEGGLGLEPLPAAPGARAPDLERRYALAELLDARPALGLVLRGRVGAEDEAALRERVLTQLVVADAALPPVEAGFFQKRRLRGALEDRAKGEAGRLDAADAAALERWLEAVPVGDAERQALARDRAQALRDALVAESDIAPERVAIGEPLQGAPGVVVELGSGGGRP